MVDTGGSVPQGSTSDGVAGMAAFLPVYWRRQTLDWIKVALRYAQFGLPDNVPLRNGTQLIWTRPGSVDSNAAPTALTEGVTPASTALSGLNLTSTLLPYGDYTLKSERILRVAFNEQVRDASEILSFKASRDIDNLIRETLTAAVAYTSTGNVLVAGSLTTPTLTSVASTSLVRANDLLASATKLHNNAIPPFFPNGDFGAVLASPCMYDLKSDTSAGGWIDINKYMSNAIILNGEEGKVHGVRVSMTQNFASTGGSAGGTASSASAYFNFIFGKGSFGTVDLNSSGVNMIIKRAKDTGTSDPLEQRASIGFTYEYAVKYLRTTMASDKHRIVMLLAATGGAF